MARILLVEDEDAILRILTTFLSKHGHVVLPFCDGEPALEALRGEDVDVIITDLSMPTPGRRSFALRVCKISMGQSWSCPALSVRRTHPIAK